MTCWIRLGIEPTKDQNAIRGAYRARLPEHHPETDPEGFQALREAYETALRHARETEQEAPAERDVSLAQATLDQFAELLKDSTRRFNPQAWEAFIQQLDLLPLEALEDISWPLLEAVRGNGILSNECVRPLARRLAWLQQLLRLDFEQAQDIEAFLARLEEPDLVPCHLINNWPGVAQQETLWYLHTLEYLYNERPLFEYEAFASQHLCLPLPKDDALPRRLLLQCSQAGIGLPDLFEWCMDEWHAHPDDLDLLYLLAVQSSLLNLGELALRYWSLLHRKHHHPQAPRHLLDLCYGMQPELLPLLIQALDFQEETLQWPDDLTDQAQVYGSNAQAPETLSRWFAAKRSIDGGIAATYVDWRIDSDQELPLLAWLLDEHPQPDLQHLYRQAWALQRGDIALLQQIVASPASDQPLDELILAGFRRQARQQLAWLEQAPVPRALKQWIESDEESPPLPAQLEEGHAPQACGEWLVRLRAYDGGALQRIVEHFHIQQLSPAPFALVQQMRLAVAGLQLPMEQDPWQWYARHLFILALMEQPQRWLELITPSLLGNLDYPPGHPFAATRDLLASWLERQAPLEALLARLDPGNLVQLRLTEVLCTVQSALDSPRYPETPVLFRHFVDDPQAFADEPYSMMLFWGVLYSDPHLHPEDRQYLRDCMQGVDHPDPWFEEFRSSLPKGILIRPQARALKNQGLDDDTFWRVQEVLARMAGDKGMLPDIKTLTSLQVAKDDPQIAQGLRLAVTALLALVERLYGLKNQDVEAEFWEFWKLKSRLGRGAFALMLVYWCLLGLLLIRLPKEFAGLGMLVALLGVLSSCLRRLHDRGQGAGTLLIMCLIVPAIPFNLFLLLVSPGDVLPNNFGMPPTVRGKKRLVDGLQNLLRPLKPKRRARREAAKGTGDGW